MNLAVIDVIFLIIIGLSALRCAVKGFVGEFLSMAALILGIMAAIFFYRTGAEFVRGQFLPGMEVVPEIIAFVSLFLIVYIIVKIIEIVLKGIIEGIRLGDLDRFLGFILGIVEGFVVICLILFLIQIQPFFDARQLLGGSLFAKILLPLILGERKLTEPVAWLAKSWRLACV